MKNAFIFIGFALFIALGVFQMIVGYQGIEHHLGVWWAIAALIGAFVFRFTIPITIGTYFGVVDVLEWHWGIGILLTAPGLLLILPSIGLIFLEPIYAKLLRKNTKLNKEESYHEVAITANDPGEELNLVLESLRTLKPKYESEVIYYSNSVDDVFELAKKAIRLDKKEVIEGIAKHKRDPIEIALTTLWNVSNQEVSIGNYHIYRGVLSEKGKGYLFVFNRTVEILLEEGYIDENEADRNRQEIQVNIKAAG